MKTSMLISLVAATAMIVTPAIGSSITCPGGAGAYPVDNKYTVTVKVSSTAKDCVETKKKDSSDKPGSEPGSGSDTGDAGTETVVNCDGYGDKCVKIEVKVKKISNGAECTQDVMLCDLNGADVKITCFGKEFTVGLKTSSNWGDVVGNGDCSLITTVK